MDILIWAQDHDETLPPAASIWTGCKTDPGILVCPTRGKTIGNAYGYNSLVSGVALGDIDKPGPGGAHRRLERPRRQRGRFSPNTITGKDDIARRHSSGAIFSYSDGHVAWSKNTVNDNATRTTDDNDPNLVYLAPLLVGAGPGHVAIPTFSAYSGAPPQTITVTCGTAGATIRYTTSGTDPTSSTGTVIASGSTVYITANPTTLKAKAFKADMADSGLATGIYSATDDVPSISAFTIDTAGTPFTSPATLPFSVTLADLDTPASNLSVAIGALPSGVTLGTPPTTASTGSPYTFTGTLIFTGAGTSVTSVITATPSDVVHTGAAFLCTTPSVVVITPNTAPTDVVITGPASPQPPGSLTFTGTCSDNAGLATTDPIKIYTDSGCGAGTELGGHSTSASSGGTGYTWSYTVTLTAGIYTLYAKATDAGGLTSGASAGYNLTINALLTGIGCIAFQSNRDGNYEIYVMNADGSGQTDLTNNPAYDWTSAWSPDGTKIAFSSNRDGNKEIYVMNADGSSPTRLTYNTADDQYPAWSPDGTKIAFESLRDGFMNIYMMNADGSGQTRLTNNPASAGDQHPSWSPDGKKIAFTSNRDGNGECYVMNADGSGQTRLTNNPAEDGWCAWSPDGTKIAFESKRDGNNEIYMMNADGSGQTRLTNNPADDSGSEWSPDGSKIVFNSNRDGNTEIYVMYANGSGQTRLTNNPADDGWADW